jgi:hypothetical protein
MATLNQRRAEDLDLTAASELRLPFHVLARPTGAAALGDAISVVNVPGPVD